MIPAHLLADAASTAGEGNVATLEWTGTVVLPDGRQFAERGSVRFLPSHRCEISLLNLATRLPWTGICHEDDVMRDLPWDDWHPRDHVFVGVRCGFPVRHVVVADGRMMRSMTTRLDTGMVTQAVLHPRTTVGEWCHALLAAIDTADMVMPMPARRR